MDVKTAIKSYMEGSGKSKGRKPEERYSSFDYCYNYFYSFYKNGNIKDIASTENLQTSCLHIGFYLASWGMMRGSSFLTQKSVKNYKHLIVTISEMNPKLWAIDVDNYDDENIKLLLNCKQKIIEVLGKENKLTDTLVTKIMLGVFANIPAYDQYFRKSLKLHNVNKKSLLKIKTFYEENKQTFDSYTIYTIDFLTSKETNIIYTKAKLIDMCGFITSQ